MLPPLSLYVPRYMVKDLIQHEFFAEESAMTVNVTQSNESPDKLLIRMKVHGEMKKKNGEEAIEFAYDLKRDNVEEVVGDMVSCLVRTCSVLVMPTKEAVFLLHVLMTLCGGRYVLGHHPSSLVVTVVM